MPAALKTTLAIVFIIVSAILVVVVLSQEGKEQGLGALTGANNTDTYWGKNKGRSAEGRKKMITRILAVLFVAIAILLNIN